MRPGDVNQQAAATVTGGRQPCQVQPCFLRRPGPADRSGIRRGEATFRPGDAVCVVIYSKKTPDQLPRGVALFEQNLPCPCQTDPFGERSRRDLAGTRAAK